MKKMKQKTTLLSYSALMCALLIVSTLWLRFTIPGTDVLVTTQVFFVLLCGQLLPPLYCLYSIGAYLFIGLLGVPVFSAACGPAVLATPSFGYLLGFPIGAALAAFLRTKWSGMKFIRYLSSFAGLLTVYVVALSYIAVLKGVFLAAPIPFATLISAYFLAFLPLDIVKTVLAALLGERLSKALRLSL